MKKFISVFLAALMLLSCFAVTSFAVEKTGECVCDGDHNHDDPCHCCLFCPNLDAGYVTSCAKGTLNSDVKIVCCYECTGLYGCKCGCECCKTGNENIGDDDNIMDEIITEQDKENFVDGFQAILKQISDFFDMLFDTIFEFLRLDEVLGRGDVVNPDGEY